MPKATALGQTQIINGKPYDSAELSPGVFGWRLNSIGERTIFLASLPVAGVDLLDGEQAVITSGNPLESMIFENVAGEITYRGQQSIPFRTTVKSAVDRNAIAAALDATDGEYWFCLTQTDAPNSANRGYYRITSAGSIGIQVGPFLSVT